MISMKPLGGVSSRTAQLSRANIAISTDIPWQKVVPLITLVTLLVHLQVLGRRKRQVAACLLILGGKEAEP